MKKIAELYTTKILDEDYNQSSKFEKEKSCDQERYIFKCLGFLDNFRPDWSFYANYKLDPEIKVARNLIKNEKFKSKYKTLIKNNAYNVDIEITKNTKKPQTQIIRDIRINDYLIDFCNLYQNLSCVHRLISKHKVMLDQGVQKGGIFESAIKYNNTKDRTKFNLVYSAIDKTFKLIKKYPTDEKFIQTCKQFYELINSYLVIYNNAFETDRPVEQLFNIKDFSSEDKKLFNQLYNIIDIKHKAMLKESKGIEK